MLLLAGAILVIIGLVIGIPLIWIAGIIVGVVGLVLWFGGYSGPRTWGGSYAGTGSPRRRAYW